MNTPIIFDIETGPLSAEKLALVEPEFTAPANYKKPEAIEAAIAKKREEWVERAALDATTGQILAIGYLEEGEYSVDFVNPDDNMTEADILEEFWSRVTQNGWVQPVVGWNSNAFDLPFIIRRSWVHGVKFPPTIRKGRYLDSNCIDLMEIWGDRARLDTVAKTLGIEGKNGEGKFFSQIFNDDQDKALDYLKNDIRVTAQVAARLGINIELGVFSERSEA